MTQFRQNVLLTVLLLGAAIYFAHLGKGEVALACMGIIAALWRHSGRGTGDSALGSVGLLFCLALHHESAPYGHLVSLPPQILQQGCGAVGGVASDEVGIIRLGNGSSAAICAPANAAMSIRSVLYCSWDHLRHLAQQLQQRPAVQVVGQQRVRVHNWAEVDRLLLVVTINDDLQLFPRHPRGVA